MAYMTKMTRRKSELLALIEQSPAMSIYQLAQTCGRNYRRVYDHVQQLAAAGYVRIRSDIRNGRRVSLVESIYHQRLRRLDDLYAFKVKAGLRVADIRSFIVSKCLAAGQQDMLDVAALCLIHSELEGFCRESASAHGCLEKLESWLNDRRLRQRYSPKEE